MQQQQLLKSLKPLLVDEKWMVFDEYLSTLIDSSFMTILNTRDVNEIMELQGRIKAYRSIRSLSETIKTMDKL